MVPGADRTECYIQNQIDELAMRAVGGFYTATTQPLVEDVQIICDITVSSAKATT